MAEENPQNFQADEWEEGEAQQVAENQAENKNAPRKSDQIEDKGEQNSKEKVDENERQKQKSNVAQKDQKSKRSSSSSSDHSRHKKRSQSNSWNNSRSGSSNRSRQGSAARKRDRNGSKRRSKERGSNKDRRDVKNSRYTHDQSSGKMHNFSGNDKFKKYSSTGSNDYSSGGNYYNKESESGDKRSGFSKQPQLGGENSGSTGSGRHGIGYTPGNYGAQGAQQPYYDQNSHYQQNYNFSNQSSTSAANIPGYGGVNDSSDPYGMSKPYSGPSMGHVTDIQSSGPFPGGAYGSSHNPPIDTGYYNNVPPPPSSAASSLVDEKTNQYYKTKICPHFETGQCYKGSNCKFAHGENEQRSTPNYAQTRMCNNFKNGACNYGANCQFAHGPQELRNVENNYGMPSYGGNNKPVAPPMPPQIGGPGSSYVDYGNPNSSGQYISKPVPNNAKTIPCKYYASGKCMHNNNCKFYHDSSMLMGGAGSSMPPPSVYPNDPGMMYRQSQMGNDYYSSYQGAPGNEGIDYSMYGNMPMDGGYGGPTGGTPSGYGMMNQPPQQVGPRPTTGNIPPPQHIYMNDPYYSNYYGVQQNNAYMGNIGAPNNSKIILGNNNLESNNVNQEEYYQYSNNVPPPHGSNIPPPPPPQASSNNPGQNIYMGSAGEGVGGQEGDKQGQNNLDVKGI